jgi:hypothetical protein
MLGTYREVQMSEIVEMGLKLPKGMLVHVHGIPVALAEDVFVKTNAGNALIIATSLAEDNVRLRSGVIAGTAEAK